MMPKMRFRQKNLDYPSLENCCTVVISKNPSAPQIPPPNVKVDPECFSAINLSLPGVPDTSLENSIVQKYKKAQENSIPAIATTTTIPSTTTSNTNTSSLSDSEKNALNIMRNITNQSEAKCLEILKKYNFDIDRSVNAFYAS